jgi:hypothetical protein
MLLHLVMLLHVDAVPANILLMHPIRCNPAAAPIGGCTVSCIAVPIHVPFLGQVQLLAVLCFFIHLCDWCVTA